MGKTCEICGKSIRTGRKYCKEHRNTLQTSGLSSMKKIERLYLRYRRKTMKLNYIYLFLGIASLIIGILLYFLLKNSWMLVIGFVLFFIFPFSDSIKREIAKNKIHKEIDNHSEEFVKFAKECGAEIKAEREFRKSIFH
jgi:hypothetical protein